MAGIENTVRMDSAALQELCGKILMGSGASREAAEIVADNLIMADLRGISSHGISRLHVYCARIDSGMTNLNPNFKFLREADAAMVMDADNALGAVAGIAAMDKVIEKARVHGMASCSVLHGNHYGIAAYFGMRALPHDMIGMTFTNAPANVAPWGGISSFFGTNPICVTIPALTKRPIVFDAATSIVARGKINLAEIENQPIPEGWAIDKLGNPTTDATTALEGSVLPFGLYKGYGIGMIIEILCAFLSGAACGPEVGALYANAKTPQDLGFFFCAMNINSFIDSQIFKGRVDKIIDDLKASQKAPGVDEIFVPGEIEFNNHDYNLVHGIEVGEGVTADLNELCARYGITANLQDYIIG